MHSVTGSPLLSHTQILHTHKTLLTYILLAPIPTVVTYLQINWFFTIFFTHMYTQNHFFFFLKWSFSSIHSRFYGPLSTQVHLYILMHICLLRCHMSVKSMGFCSFIHPLNECIFWKHASTRHCSIGVLNGHVCRALSPVVEADWKAAMRGDLC